MLYLILFLLIFVACGDVPQGLPDDPGLIGVLPENVAFTGAGAILMGVVNLILRVLSTLTKTASLMRKQWFRVAIPIATVALSTAVWVTLAILGQVSWTSAVNAFLGMGMSAIAWWELVGQHIFKKPSEMGIDASDTDDE